MTDTAPDTAPPPHTPAASHRPDDITDGFVVRGRQSDADMAADVMSHHRPADAASPAAYLGSNRTSLPPLVTSPPSHAKLERASSYANKRMSTFSTASNTHNPAPRSRPQSVAFPAFHSSLPYALVRDFAYEPEHPLYYGPLPQEHRSGASTPASDANRRLSDPPPVAWRTDRASRLSGPQHLGLGEQLPMTSFGDGPPYSEDEDLASPVVTSHHSARHKKQKSNQVDFDQTRGRRAPEEHRRSSVTGVNGEGSYYPSHVNDAANGIGGEYITYPPSSSASNLDVPEGASRRDSHFAAILPQRSYANEQGPPYDSDEDMSEPGDYIRDDNRFSRDYQFTIASPDEEMHGKAVALFDFARENDNELPLVEGQVILVSYRHGQGWLVAQDPKTGESGLVPEEYVRLLRDIEGGWNGLMNGAVQAQEANPGLDSLLSPISAGPEAKTPTQADHSSSYTPVISTFSTSHKDLEPYPKDRLATPTNPEGGSFGKGKEGGPMDGIETTPEPQSKHQDS